MPPGQYRGCGRGVFALSSWKIPLRRPQALLQSNKASDLNEWRVGQKLMMKYSHKPQPNSPLEKELAVKQLDNVVFVSRYDENWIVVRSADGEEGCVPDKYVMEEEGLYYLCSENKGADQLRICKKFIFLQAAQDEKVKNLPWLESKTQEQNLQQGAVEWKPYKSAYGPKETETTTTASSGDDEQYYCKICEKQLNGPIPYNMHLNSKAHKEELEVHMDM